MDPNEKAIGYLSRKSGLSMYIVRMLMRNGWTYSQELNKPPRWEKV